jgi:Bacterial TniB protein
MIHAIFDEFHNCLRGRRRDVEAIFAALRRLGREYDISPALVGEAAVYDHINLTDEMASRFALAPVPRWRYGEDYLALLDSLEAALPLAGLRAFRTRRSRARSSPCPKG